MRLLKIYIGSYNTLNNLPNKVRVPSKAGDLYLSVFTIITEVNDTKTLTRLTSFEVNVNLMVQKVIQIRSGITMNIF